jgi:hypothetical protein
MEAISIIIGGLITILIALGVEYLSGRTSFEFGPTNALPADSSRANRT